MTARVLLDQLRAKGIEIRVENGKLRVSAPRGELTEAIRAELADRKDELIATLASDNGASHGAFTMPEAANEGPGSAILTELYRIRFHSLNDLDRLESAPPYVRFVNPRQGSMLQKINMDKQYVRGEGCALYDGEGARYLDFVAAYGALPFGHNPESIWEAVEQTRRDQAPSFIQPSTLDAAGRLAERLIAIAPEGMRYVTFANSGAEAVEAALKLCRSATQRPGILSTLNSFHGKTLGALSATGRRIYQKAFGAPAPGFHYVPFGDAEALEHAFVARPRYYAGFIVEPIQGEGGMVDPPPGYLAQAESICRRHDVLLVVDEIQTGLGRTGALFACEHEGVTPDVITLAKALGGGVMPIGAVLCKEPVYNEDFATLHTSTFGGNTLACNAGIAALDVLERDDRALVHHVDDVGTYLRAGLTRLVEQYPAVAKSVRGRGLMLGLQFNLESELYSQGFIRYLCDQGVFTYVLAAYLLNVHQIRVAPTLSAPDVLRIEPPLIVTQTECDVLLEALDESMSMLDQSATAQFLAHIAGADLRGRPVPPPRPDEYVAVSPVHPSPALPDEGRFGFVTHLGDEDSWTQLDPCLEIFTQEEMTRLKNRVVDLFDPVPGGEVEIQSITGQRARGEFVVLPFSASELIEMPVERSLAEIRYAVQLCKERGAKIVGLGGFNSIITQGGLVLEEESIVPLSTGNSYTAAAGVAALELACAQRDREMSNCTASVIGAAGAVGKAVATLLAERVASLRLVGNPAHPERSLARLTDIAADILGHLWRRHAAGVQFEEGTLGHRLISRRESLPEDPQPAQFELIAHDFIQRDQRIVISTDPREGIQDADLVTTATSSVETMADEHAFKCDAIVCELSRPFNFGDDVKQARRDVLFIEGGLTRIPGGHDLGIRNGLAKGQTFACVAETMMLALEQNYENTSLGVNLDMDTIERLQQLAEKHGFTVVL